MSPKKDFGEQVASLIGWLLAMGIVYFVFSLFLDGVLLLIVMIVAAFILWIEENHRNPFGW